MAKQAWSPWHEVVRLRDDVRTGELSLATFAADLYEVVMKRGTRPAYEEPEQFFALTYPTTNLRDLARDVMLRLAGRNDKAIRQLELTYGGGKTHTLIALYHLVHDPAALPDLPAVREFREHAGIQPPRSRVAVLPFDKLDVEKGMVFRSPEGEERRLLHPWSGLAWQIAGEAGLKLLHAEDRAEERETAPAESLLEPLLRLPHREGLGTLVLVDEVLMYAHEKVSYQREWLGRLRNFFQYVTQAVVKVDRAAMVASLLATDPAKSDDLGRTILAEIAEVFGREREEGVEPVLKEDVAEVLRRRFFTPESIANREAFRSHVFAALQGIADLHEGTRKAKKAAEERFLASYPFHPDLTEVFYAKWTNLAHFQRTRGALRTFALALRDAESWDQSPLVGPNVFLAKPGAGGISEAARELTSVATKEQIEGGAREWSPILEAELAKAREAQDDYPVLRHREIEQAVFATFVHSQPPGAKAHLDELLALVGSTRPDKISLEKALRLWFEKSWFLDESAAAQVQGQPTALPVSWRLGTKPNLRQMHAEAVERVPEELIEARLLEDVRRLKALTAGASAAGARVHLLPDKPSDVEDDGEFHYAVLGPAAASESGKPNPEARRFLEENTGPDNPRKERNAVVLAVPSREGLHGARRAVRDYLGWEEVRTMLKGQDVDPIRAGLLATYTDAALRRIPAAIAQAYCVVVTVSEANEVHAFRVQPGDQPLFLVVKADKRSRIQDTAISAEAMLPGGPYDLWREGEDARPVQHLVGAFARNARLPKMLSRRAILDTVIQGCLDGVLVARVMRPDKSLRTFWRVRLDDTVLGDPSLELVLPAQTELTELDAGLLAPGVLADLWTSPSLAVSEVRAFFGGGRVIHVDRGSFREAIAVPQARAEVVDAAIAAAVRAGTLWLTSGPASILGEVLPHGLLTDTAVLQGPPPRIAASDLLPDHLPEAWRDGQTTALALATALSQRAGRTIPWATVREALDGALRAALVELAPESAAWPCEFAAAGRLQVLPRSATPSAAPVLRPAGVRAATADLTPAQVQDLADAMSDLLRAKGDADLVFRLTLELTARGANADALAEAVNRVLREKVGEGLDLC